MAKKVKTGTPKKRTVKRLGAVTLGVRTLRSLCIDVILVSSKGHKFLKGLAFMRVADMIPDRLSIMMVNSIKFHLQFWIPKVDMHPFTVIFKNFKALMGGIGHLKIWNIQVLEIMNCTFVGGMPEVEMILRAMKTLRPKTVILMNCDYNKLIGDYRERFFGAISNRATIRVIIVGGTVSDEPAFYRRIKTKDVWEDACLEEVSEEIHDECVAPKNGTETAPFPRKLDLNLLKEVYPEDAEVIAAAAMKEHAKQQPSHSGTIDVVGTEGDEAPTQMNEPTCSSYGVKLRKSRRAPKVKKSQSSDFSANDADMSSEGEPDLLGGRRKNVKAPQQKLKKRKRRFDPVAHPLHHPHARLRHLEDHL